MNELDIAKSLIPQLLSSSSSEYGARLKQRLNAELIAQGFSPFNEKQLGYKKFSEFLNETFGNILQIERPAPSGDVLVSLKAKPRSPSLPPSFARGSSQVIRSDVWQAFTNPDESRKRFLSKSTKEIVHFREGGESPYEAQTKSSPEDFIQIDFIPGELQQQWMLAFIDQKRLSPSDREALATIIQGKYSSSLNAAFTRALGADGEAWRECRTARIEQAIKGWANDNCVDFFDLCTTRSQSQISNTKNIATQSLDHSTPKARAVHLLALLNDEDISRIIIPTILSTLLLRTNS